MRTAFLALLAFAVIFTMAWLAISSPTTHRAPVAPQGTHSPLMHQAYAQLTATAATDGQREADLVVTAVARQTAQAQAAIDHQLTVEAASTNATRQAKVDLTAAAEAAQVQKTQTALEETRVAATLEAGSIRSTTTTEAQIVRETATAQAIATRTAEAASVRATTTARADIAATETARPIQTETAREQALKEAEHDRQVAQITSETRLAPLVYLAKLFFWVVLISIGLWTLFWGIPRLFNALLIWLGRDRNGNDKSVYVLAILQGAWEAWLDPLKLLTYDPDRDRGPGQIIDGKEPAGPLPGYDPNVTFQDQAIDARTRPVEASHRHGPQIGMMPAPPLEYVPRLGPPGYQWQVDAPRRIPGIRSVRTIRSLRHAEGLLPDTLIVSLEKDWNTRGGKR